MVSIIVPARNEGKNITDTLNRLREVHPQAEVIVVDGGTDDTGDRVRELQSEWKSLRYFLNVDDRGKGHAIRVGIGLATQPYIAQIDSDLQFYPEDLTPMFEILEHGHYDFVCGSRFALNSKREKKSVPGFRSMGNRMLSLYTTFLTQQKFTDILAGIKVWKREVTESFEFKSDDFCYEVELPIKAMRCGFRVCDYGVRTAPREHGKSSVNVVRVGLSLLAQIPRFRWGKI